MTLENQSRMSELELLEGGRATCHVKLKLRSNVNLHRNQNRGGTLTQLPQRLPGVELELEYRQLGLAAIMSRQYIIQ